MTKSKKIIVATSVLAVILLFASAFLFWVEKEPQECEVIFYSDNERVISVSRILSGQTAIPPVDPQLRNGLVFQKWDKDVTNIKQDTEFHPQYVSVSESENAFVIPGTYGEYGTTVSVPLKLCGKVCLSGVDLTVEYDSDVLQLKDVTNADEAVIYNGETPGMIRLNYVSTENTTADVDLCNFSFNILKDISETPIHIKVNSICANGEQDEFYVPTYTLVDASVYAFSVEGGAENG